MTDGTPEYEERYETGGEHEAPVGHAHDRTVHMPQGLERGRHVPVPEGEGNQWTRATWMPVRRELPRA
jgi:hypothetical protein